MFQRQALFVLLVVAVAQWQAQGASQHMSRGSATAQAGGGRDRGWHGPHQYVGPVTGCVKWQFQTSSPVTASVAIGPGSVIYVVSEAGMVYAVDEEGHMLWNTDVGSEITSSPAVDPDGTVYVGCFDGRLVALSSQGQVLWTSQTGSMICATPAVAADGRLFVGSTDGTVRCLAIDGSQLWVWKSARAATAASAIVASPVIGSDGSVIVGDVFWPALYSLDPNDGAVNWQADFTQDIVGKVRQPDGTMKAVPVMYGRLTAAPAVGPDGTIYVSFDGASKLCAVSPTGERIWTTEVSYPVGLLVKSNIFAYYYNTVLSHMPRLTSTESWSSPVVGPDGTVWLDLGDPLIRAVEPNGVVKSITRCGLQGAFDLASGADGRIYACGDEGSMYVVEPDGSPGSVFDGYGWMSHPVIAADGTLYVSDANGLVWAIDRHCPRKAMPDLHRMADAAAPQGVDFVDYAAVLQDWMKTTWDYRNVYTATPTDPRLQTSQRYLATDVNRDAYVDMLDIALVAEQWLQR